eukprot:c15606_g1_i1.p1 GENE.c15606_g1_i1~~c15606_g1_i1.p1  ORF type:complete len:366 (-),score=146.98 c15606_g1_i1:32-1129(-)
MQKENVVRLGFAFGGALVALSSVYLLKSFKKNSVEHKVRKESGFFIGIDIGGTKLACGLVDSKGSVVSHKTVPLVGKEVHDVSQLICSVVKDILRSESFSLKQVTAIGIGFPGSIDNEKGIVRKVSNFPNWKDVPLASIVSELLENRPVYLENDAKAAGLAEMWVGAGKDPKVKDMVMLTIGTGIGGAIICNGKVIRGVSDMAGEIGHSIIEINGRACENTGVRGTLEKYASGPAVLERAKEAISSNRFESSSLSLTNLTTREVFKQAENGDKLAQQIVEETYEYLGVTCINICRFIDPPLIVMTGGVTETGDSFFDGVRKAFKRHHWKILEPACQIVPSGVKNHAGYIGAAGSAKIAAYGYLKD